MAENWKTLAALFVIPTFLCVLAAIDTQNFPNPIRTNTPVIVVRFECRVPRHLLGSSSHEFRTHSLELQNPRNESMAKITTAGLVTNLHSDATAKGHADYMYWQNNNLTVVTPLTDGGEYRCIIEYTPDGRAQHNETLLIKLDEESVGETKRDRDGFSAETFAADHVLVTWRPPVTGKLIHSTVSVESGGSGLELYPKFPLFTANGEDIPFVYSKVVLLSNFSTPRGTAGNFTISVYVSKNLCKPTCRYLCEISYPSCVGPDASNCFCDGADSCAPTLTTPLSLPTRAPKPAIAMENASTTLVPSGSKYPTADPKQGESGNSNSSENCAGWRAGVGVSIGVCMLPFAAFIFVYFCWLRKCGKANDAKGEDEEELKPLIELNDVLRELSDILNSADSRVQNESKRIVEEIKRLQAVAEMRQQEVTTIGEKEKENRLNEKLDHLSKSMGVLEEKVGRLRSTGTEGQHLPQEVSTLKQEVQNLRQRYRKRVGELLTDRVGESVGQLQEKLITFLREKDRDLPKSQPGQEGVSENAGQKAEGITSTEQEVKDGASTGQSAKQDRKNDTLKEKIETLHRKERDISSRGERLRADGENLTGLWRTADDLGNRIANFQTEVDKIWKEVEIIMRKTDELFTETGKLEKHLCQEEQTVSRLITSLANIESISKQDLVRLESDVKRLKEENRPNKMSDDYHFHKNKNVSANVNTSSD